MPWPTEIWDPYDPEADAQGMVKWKLATPGQY